MVSVKNSRIEYVTVRITQKHIIYRKHLLYIQNQYFQEYLINDQINEQNIEGRTLLHISCQYNKLDVNRLIVILTTQMTRCLFTYNPDITIRDAYGLLAIHYAVLANVLFIHYLHLQREELLEEFWKVLGITDEQAKEVGFLAFL